jgi:NADPH:quinone reductase-like Zn-dependent oxidoreductase
MTDFGEWSAAGRITPQVCATFPLDDFKDAMALVLSRKSIGRVAFVMESGD